MMKVTSYHRGQTMKTVNVEDVDCHHEDEILATAMFHANESRDRLWGWNVTLYPDENAAVVTLHTD